MTFGTSHFSRLSGLIVFPPRGILSSKAMPEELPRICRFSLTAAFVRAVIRLSAAETRRVWKTLDILARNPNNPGWGLEDLRGTEGLKSVRLSDSLRIILSGDTPPVLEFVGGHDEAYRLASRMSKERTELFGKYPLRVLLEPPSLRVARSSEPSELPMIDLDVQASAPSVRELPQPLHTDTVERLLTRSKKYLPLTLYLASRPPTENSLTLSFVQVEHLLVARLPMSARVFRPWWANDATHVQATAWLAAGWQTTEVDMQQQKVKFVRSVI